MRTHRFGMLAAAVLAAGALLWAGWAVWPESGPDVARSLVKVEATLGYELAAGGDTLVVDSCRQTVAGLYVSRRGHVVAPLALGPDSVPAGCLARRLSAEAARGRADSARLSAQLEQLDYYARTHTARDEGYTDVMTCRAGLAAEQAAVCARLARIGRLAARRLRPARARRSFRIYSVTPAGRGRADCTVSEARLEAADSGLVLLQAAGSSLPAHAGHLGIGLLPAEGALRPRRLCGFAVYALVPQCLASLPGTAVSADSAAGLKAAFVEAFVPATRRDERRVARLLYGGGRWREVLFGRSGARPAAPRRLAAWAETHGALRADGGSYRGGLQGRRRAGYGRLERGDTLVAEGFWAADTLARGRLSTPSAGYEGGLGRGLLPSGYGRERTAGGAFFRGHFASGRREGYGFDVGAGAIVRSGLWRGGRYRGERLTPDADRVYGIDISRHQHEKGRRRYGIDWSRLRITSLGALGACDLPVSFVYIKATEDVSVRNRYYAADRAAARRRGIRTGAYHFFSTRRPGRAQADFFLRHACLRRGDLPPVLDVEPTDAQIAAMGGAARMWAGVKAWVERVAAAAGTRPVLYVSQSFIDRYFAAAPREVRDCPVWVARYSAFRPSVRLLHWQLTPRGRVRGITGEVDINVYNGEASAFASEMARMAVR